VTGVAGGVASVGEGGGRATAGGDDQIVVEHVATPHEVACNPSCAL
jgi:hypothetical protein